MGTRWTWAGGRSARIFNLAPVLPTIYFLCFFAGRDLVERGWCNNGKCKHVSMAQKDEVVAVSELGWQLALPDPSVPHGRTSDCGAEDR
jgi:hypothetical protein